MRKSLIIPILCLVILGISAFVFLNKNEGTGNKDIALPSSLFNTADFYDMKTLNQKQINTYLKKTGKNILSSVGCYQVEKLGPQIIKSIKGDFFNVLGFPLFPFLTFLSKR